MVAPTMSAASNASQSSANLFRRLVWQSTLTLSIRLADGEPGAGTGADRYYMQVPRYTYLPLLLPEIRENLVELLLDDEQLAATDERDWWFEEEPDDKPNFAGQGACRWHWPLDLIQLHSIISRPSTPLSPIQPLRLLLHLKSPPLDKLLMPNTPETCKSQYINRLKEADFVRWRNTNKVTSLRRADLDAGWEGIENDDYDQYMRMATRLLPLPIPPSDSSTDATSALKQETSYAARALPLKIYLPDGAPVIQDVIPPLGSNGQAQTLWDLLSKHLPLLFPFSTTPYKLARPMVQGAEVPPEAELAWLSACLCGVDGWLRIGIQIQE